MSSDRRDDPIDRKGRRIITLFCTDRGTHEPKRVGTLIRDDWRPVTRWYWRKNPRVDLDHADQPEKCPVCSREPRRSMQAWEQIAEHAETAGESSLDVSLMR